MMGKRTPPSAVEENPESGREGVLKYSSGTDTDQKTLGKIGYFKRIRKFKSTCIFS